MNKLNIGSILVLIDQLSYEDSNLLKEKISNQSWVIKFPIRKKFYLVNGNNEDEIIEKMILDGFPYHYYHGRSLNCETCNRIRVQHDGMFMGIRGDFNWIDEQNMINIITDKYCFLCDSKTCNHIKKGINCLERSNINKENIKKIIKCMIKKKLYIIDKINNKNKITEIN